MTARVASVLTALSIVLVIAFGFFGLLIPTDDSSGASGALNVFTCAVYVAVLGMGAFCLWTAYDRPPGSVRLVVLLLVALHWLANGAVEVAALFDEVDEGIGETSWNVVVLLASFALAAFVAAVAFRRRTGSSTVGAVLS